jgi:hypothetical protein
MANTELPSSSTYVLGRLAKRLMSNVLVIVEIVPGYDNFMAVGLR